jgi:hypothetical protein
MADNDPNGSKKHFISMPKDFAKLSDEEIDQFASELYGQIIGKLSEDLIPSSHEQVTRLVVVNFPGAELTFDTDNGKSEFLLFFEEKLLLTIDNIGWTFTTGDHGWKWEDIKEGGIEAVAEDILQALAQHDFVVYDPSGGLQGGKKGKRRLTKR